MKLYVWRGDRVLKNYRSGMVVVSAASTEAAWAKLKEADFRAYHALLFGVPTVDTEEEAKYLREDEFPDAWEAVEPEEFEPVDLPVLVMWGGE